MRSDKPLTSKELSGGLQDLAWLLLLAIAFLSGVWVASLRCLHDNSETCTGLESVPIYMLSGFLLVWLVAASLLVYVRRTKLRKRKVSSSFKAITTLAFSAWFGLFYFGCVYTHIGFKDAGVRLLLFLAVLGIACGILLWRWIAVLVTNQFFYDLIDATVKTLRRRR